VEEIGKRLTQGDIVCVTPLGVTAAGKMCYLNSEELAKEVASQLKAAKLVYFTEGQRIVDTRRNHVVAAMQVKDAKAFIKYARGEGEARFQPNRYPLSAQVIRYVELLVSALAKGTRRGHLIDAARGALLQELYTPDGSGTVISQDLYDGIRLAQETDVAGILDLIQPLVEAKLLKKRTPTDIERACLAREMFVWKRDDITLGVAQLYCFDDDPSAGELGCFVVSPLCRGKGHGSVLLAFMERIAGLQGLTKLFLLTTQTMQWFMEHGFRECKLDALPESKQAVYDAARHSRMYMKRLDSMSSEAMERFTFAEVTEL